MSGEDRSQTNADESALALMHSAVLSSISLFDQKCSMLLTIDSGALVFCVSTVAGLVPGAPDDFHLVKLGGILLIATAVFLLVSAVSALRVVWPQTRHSGDDPLFWDTWSDARETVDYFLPIEKLSPDKVTAAKSRHVGLLGDICRRKMARLKTALVFALVGLLVLLLIAVAHLSPWGRHLLAAPIPVEDWFGALDQHLRALW